jgi:hypothetical protein
MKPDGMLVEPEFLVSARQDVATQGSGPAMTDLAQIEPVLASFLHESLAAVAGKLALAGAPTELIQAVHEEVLGIALTSLRALRRSHYEFWKHSMEGTLLAQLDAEFCKKTPRRRRKRGGNDTATGSEGSR